MPTFCFTLVSLSFMTVISCEFLWDSLAKESTAFVSRSILFSNLPISDFRSSLVTKIVFWYSVSFWMSSSVSM